MDADEELQFHDFVVGQWHALLRTAFLLTGEHAAAEDLVQGTLVRVHRSWHRIERRDAPAVYARRVMVNLNTSIWRRHRGREQVVDVVPDRSAPDATAAYDLRDQLRRACLTLPPRQRAVLVLRYFEDMTEAETAAAMGISVGAVKSQTSRGLVKLRAVLDGDPQRSPAAPAGPTTTATANGSQA